MFLQRWLLASPLVLRPQGIRPLTTLERVQGWLSPDQGNLNPSQAQTDLLNRLIVSVSGLVMSYLNRDTLARTERTETYPASRTGRLLLRHWPVISASSVAAPPAQPMASSLYSLEPIGQGSQRLVVNQAQGGSFLCGPDGWSVTYVTGYVKAEQHTIPSSAPYNVQTDSVLLFDEGVADYAGNPMPSSLYTVSSTGLYTFDSSQAGLSVTLVYSYVPEDIENAVIDEIGRFQRYRQRIGEDSRALPNGGGTSSYTPRRLSDITKEALNNYCRVVPA